MPCTRHILALLLLLFLFPVNWSVTPPLFSLHFILQWVFPTPRVSKVDFKKLEYPGVTSNPKIVRSQQSHYPCLATSPSALFTTTNSPQPWKLRTVVLKLGCASESLGSIWKWWYLDPHPHQWKVSLIQGWKHAQCHLIFPLPSPRWLLHLPCPFSLSAGSPAFNLSCMGGQCLLPKTPETLQI